MILDNPLISDKRVEKEALTLKEAGFSLKIYATVESGLPGTTHIHSNIEVKRCIGSWLNRPLLRTYNDEVDTIAELIEQEKHDIIYCHDYKTIAIGTRLKQRNPSLRLVYDCHEYLRGWPIYKEAPNILNKVKGFLVWKQFLKLEKKGFKACDLVVCTSPMIANKLQEEHQLTQKLVVVQNIPEGKASIILDSKSLLGIASNKMLIAHVGSMYFEQKELQQILRIIESSTAFQMVFIGNRPYHTDLKTYCTEHHFKNIHVIDYEAYPIMDFLAGCDLGLVHIQSKKYPNHDFASSNKFMEYMQAGIPIISVNQSMHRAMNEELTFTSFYDANNLQSFKNALDHALKNHQEFKKNVVKVSVNFNWQDQVSPLVHEIQNLAKIIKNDSK